MTDLDERNLNRSQVDKIFLAATNIWSLFDLLCQMQVILMLVVLM